MTLPANQTLEAAQASGAALSYTASAHDIVDGAVAAACVPASGSTFPFGSTTVNCSATDAHGNTASGSFTVTVADTTGPTLTVPANATVEATNAAGAIYTFTASAITPRRAVATTCAPASGSTFPFGPTIVNCTATDAHGNHTTKSFSHGRRHDRPDRPSSQRCRSDGGAGAPSRTASAIGRWSTRGDVRAGSGSTRWRHDDDVHGDGGHAMPGQDFRSP
jgi:hypothetical protein